MSKTAIETHTGVLFDYADPKPWEVSLDDIAHALSLTVRFGGHIKHFYSVAQHSILVAKIVGQANPLHPRLPALQRAALFHDAHEAYVGDIPTPMKRAINGTLDDMVANIDDVICRSQDVDPELLGSEAVKAADAIALRIEATELKIDNGAGFAEAAGVQPAHSSLFSGRDWMLPSMVEAAFKWHSHDLREEENA